MRTSALTALTLTSLLLVSTLSLGGLTTGATAATGISECTTIDESGTYELTSDLTYEGNEPCLLIDADDVTLVGNGHTITNTGASDGSDTIAQSGIGLSNQQNVTIRDVRLGGDARVDLGDASNVRIIDNRLEGGLGIQDSRDITVRDNDFAGAGAIIHYTQNLNLVGNDGIGGEIDLRYNMADVTVANNSGGGSLNVEVRTGELVVTNNTLTSVDTAGAEGTAVEVTRNTIDGGTLGVNANGVARVHNNTVTGGGLTLGGTADDFLVTHNTITDAEIGVQITGGSDAGPAVTLEHNEIVDNQIGIETRSDRPVIHQNDLSGNSGYGVVYTQEDGVVNATNNYWGAGPSSPEDDDAPFEDPRTGALANGTGSAVSEGAAAASGATGVSNVHFDPWLTTAPAAGVVEAPGDGTQQTTPTTTTTTTTTTVTTTATATTTTATATDATTTTEDETTTTTSTTGGPDTTNTPTETATTTATTGGATNTIITATEEEETPGFGVLGGLIALLATALLVYRREA